MKTRSLLPGVVAVTAAAMVGANFRLFSSKDRTATPTQIEAALPASLKATDAPDPAGEARYGRLLVIVRGVDPKALRALENSSAKEKGAPSRAEAIAHAAPTFRALESLLAEGGIRYLKHTGSLMFPEVTKLKDLAKLIQAASDDAAARGDRAECARLVALNLRFGQALVDGKGVVIEELVAVAIDAIANHGAYTAEMTGGLDAKGRAATLALMPTLEGPMPAMGDALRRDFQEMMLPLLEDPKRYMKDAALGYGNGDPEGTFDPLATARLIGRIDDETIADTHRRFTELHKTANALAEQAGAGLPGEISEGEDAPQGLSRAWQRLWYRFQMSSGANTLGRRLASQGVFDSLGTLGPHRAAERNLVRAVILLRSGATPKLTDPYGGGKLRMNPTAKIVWSVGENGKDDGGTIGKAGASGEPDLGYAYGDGAWKPISGIGRSIPGAPPQDPDH